MKSKDTVKGIMVWLLVILMFASLIFTIVIIINRDTTEAECFVTDVNSVFYMESSERQTFDPGSEELGQDVLFENIALRGDRE